MIPLFYYTAFPAIFIFVISHVATATLPLPKPKLSRKFRMIKNGNHFKTASKNKADEPYGYRCRETVSAKS